MTTAFAIGNTQTSAHATGTPGKTIEDVLGVPAGNSIISVLTAHENDGYYLGTAYGNLGPNYFDDPNTTGDMARWDCRYPNGAPKPGVGAYMNCAGFVSRVVMDAGGNVSELATWRSSANGANPNYASNDCNARKWYYYALDHSVETYYFNSKQEMLSSGVLEKGDIIFCDTDRTVSGSDYHIGFFWGNTSSEDKFWHSSSHGDGLTAGSQPGNMISQITPKSTATGFLVIKTRSSGKLTIQKSDVYTAKTTPQGDGSFQNAQFTVSNGSNSTTITTNASGYGEANLMPGTYTVTETAAPAGYKPIDPFQVTINAGQTTVATNGGTGNTVAETPKKGGIRIRKVDGSTLLLDYFDNGEAQGDATLDGTTFYLYNRSASTVRVGGKDYAKDARITTIPLEGGSTSDVLTIKNGTAATAADALPYGTYEVVEAKPGTGYNQSSDKQTFQVREDGVIVDPGATSDDAKIENNVITGGVAIAKFTQDFTDDASEKDKTNNQQGDATFKGAQFTLTNVSDKPIQIDGKVYDVDADIVDHILTVGDDGYARSGKILPYGTYELRETKAPAGYKLDDTVWRFSIRKDGQTITFDKMTGSTEVDGGSNNGAGANRGAIEDNYHGGIKVIKADKDLFELRDNADELPEGYEYGHAQGDAGTLDGTEFGVWNKSAHKVDVGGRIYEPDERIMTIPLADGTTSDVLVIENGTAETSVDALPYGTYEVRETKSVPTYETTAQKWTVTIREADEGKIKEPDAANVIKDSVVRGGITMPKVDHDLAGIDGEAEKENNAQGDSVIEGAEFGVRNMSQNEVVVGGHVYQTGERITTIPQPDGSTKDVIVADANGLASTSANALPVGKYQIWETKAPEGYELNTTDTWTVEISLTETNTNINKNVKPGNIDDRIDDKVIRGGLSVQKVDKETGTGDTLTSGSVTPEDDATDENAEDATDEDVSEQARDANGDETDESTSDESPNETTSDGEYTEPEFSPGSDLSGTQFAIVNRSKSHVYVDGTLYKVGEVVKTITTDGKGYAATEANELPYGTYDVYEVAEPVRYISSADSYGNSNAIDEDGEFVLDDEGNRLTPKFVQTVVIREPNVIVPCARPFANQVKRGDIAFEKIDDDGNTMPNVAFKVTSKTTGESHIIMTDENGVFDSSSNHTRHSKDTNANDGAFNSDGNIDDSALNGDSGVWFYGNAAGEPFWTDEDKTLPNNTDRFGFIPVIEHEEKFIGFDDIEKDENGQVVDGITFQVNESGEWVEYTTTSTAAEKNDDGDEVDNGDDVSTGVDALSSVVLTYDAEASTFSLTIDDGEPLVLGVSDIRFPNPDADELTYVQEITDPSLLFDVYDGEYWNRVGVGAVNQDGLVTKSVTQNEDGTWTIEYVTTEQYATATDEDAAEDEGAEDTDGSDAGVSTQTNEESDTEPDDSEDADTDVDADAEDEPIISEGSVDVTENEDGSLTCTYPSDWVMSVISTTQACGMNRFGYVDADGDGEYDFPADYDESEAYTETTQYPMYTPDDLLGAFPYDTYVFEELPSEATYGHKLVTFEVNVERHNYTVDLGPVTDNIIDLHTTATDQEDGDKQLATNEQVTIVDRVEYTNLNEGREYTVTGVLMDYETAEPLLDRDGNQITSTVTFTPESPNGYIDVTFTLDASQLGGVQTVVFEDLYLNKVHVASHADIEDEGQRVEFSPEIHTTALGKDTNDHFVYDAPSVTIVDTVHYEGLIPGREFVVQGVLMDRSTGEELVDSQGNTVTSEAHFVPESSTGDVQVEFTFDSTSLVGVDTVVFEDLYRIDTGGEANGQLRHVASHRDINDEGQTVSVRLSDLASDLVQTGSSAVVATVTGGAAVATAVVYAISKRKR